MKYASKAPRAASGSGRTPQALFLKDFLSGRPNERRGLGLGLAVAGFEQRVRDVEGRVEALDQLAPHLGPVVYLQTGWSLRIRRSRLRDIKDRTIVRPATVFGSSGSSI